MRQFCAGDAESKTKGNKKKQSEAEEEDYSPVGMTEEDLQSELQDQCWSDPAVSIANEDGAGGDDDIRYSFSLSLTL